MNQPFITFITPTYRRPEGLTQCLASVGRQTAREHIEQIVLPDHVGRGIAGMYAELPKYVDAVHGEYVHILADDDELASSTVVSSLREFVYTFRQLPALLITTVIKGGAQHPGVWPPVEGQIDLGNLVIRADVWKKHVHSYGKRYEGDFDFALALATDGFVPVRCDLLLLFGDVRRGAPEVAA